MQRVTITLDDDLMADLDRIIATRGYQNRSEAIRDLARSGLEQAPGFDNLIRNRIEKQHAVAERSVRVLASRDNRTPVSECGHAGAGVGMRQCAHRTPGIDRLRILRAQHEAEGGHRRDRDANRSEVLDLTFHGGVLPQARCRSRRTHLP